MALSSGQGLAVPGAADAVPRALAIEAGCALSPGRPGISQPGLVWPWPQGTQGPTGGPSSRQPVGQAGRRQKPSDLGAGERGGSRLTQAQGWHVGAEGPSLASPMALPLRPPEGVQDVKGGRAASQAGALVHGFRARAGCPRARAECEGPAPQEEGPGHSGAPGTRQQHGPELGPRWLVPEPWHPQAERQ